VNGDTEMTFPDWVICEIENPADEGGRNQQLIKIGPTILRCGATLERLEEIFQDMQPDLPEGEINTLLEQSKSYAKTAQKPVPTADSLRRRELREAAAAVLPQILKHPRSVPSARIPLLQQRKLFLRTLFDADDVVWIGEKHHSGICKKTKRARSWAFKPRDQWLAMPSINGCFICPSTFKPGSYSRCDASVVKRKYLVVESDVLNPQEVMAVFAELENHHGLSPRALVTTGGKSLHAWFDWPDGVDAGDWAALLEGYDCDPATVRPSQPVRLPGVIRPDTGRPQELLLIGD